ncbi:hypothetical protein [Streptomyces sp. NPDC086777]
MLVFVDMVRPYVPAPRDLTDTVPRARRSANQRAARRIQMRCRT